MKFLATAFLCFFVNLLNAQVQIVAEQDQDRNLTLIALNKGEIPYTIRIEFLKLENLESLEGNILFKVSKPGKSNLVKLRSIYVNKNTSFNYNTKLFKGNYLPSAEEHPLYLAPVEAGTDLSMRPLTIQISQNQEIQPYAGVGFFFEKPAVICAPRKGIVSEIKMDKENTSSGPTDFESENFLEIYHQDGTFSRLAGIKANSVKVTVGETVFPGQAIAESSSPHNDNTHHVKMIQSKWEMGEMGMVWVNFPVNIFSGREIAQSDQTISELKSIHPEEVITKEMDKKELKRLLGK